MRYKIFWIVLLSILIVPSFRPLMRPGYFPMHDDMQAMRLFQMDKCIKDGQIPCRWVPDMGYGYGYPQFNYYPPLPYYIMEILHLGGLSFLDSVKAGFALSLILSALAIFFLAQELFGSMSALLSSVFYIYSPIRASDIYSRGAMGEAWAFVFMPLIFLGAVTFLKNGNFKSLLWLSLGVGGLFLSHNPTSLIFIPAAFFIIILYLLTIKLYRLIPKVVLSFILGFSLAAFFIIPAMAEIKYAHTETLTYGYFDYRAHFSSIRQLLSSTHFGFGSSELGPFDDHSFSLGIVHWSIGILALLLTAVAILRYRSEKSLSLVVLIGVMTIFSSFMMHQKSSLIWEVLPRFNYLQFPWRFLVVTTFGLPLLSGALVYHIKKPGAKLLALFILIPLTILLNGFFFQPKAWIDIDDRGKFQGENWQKQLTISIFDYLPKSAKAPPAEKAPESPFISGFGEISHVAKGSKLYSFNAKIDDLKSNVTVPLYDFPGWKVYVDGQSWDHQPYGDLGLISFDLQNGAHQVNLKFENTPVRVFANFITLLSLGTFLVILFRPKFIYEKVY